MNRNAVWVAAVAAFLSEIALFVGAGYAAARIAPGAWAIPAVILVVVLLGLTWNRWMSPNADHRLRPGHRMLFGCALFLGVAAVLSAAGVWWGPVLGLAGCAATVVAQPVTEQLHVSSRS